MEIPLPVYLSVKVHVKTRKKEFENTLASLGMGTPKDFVVTISSQIANINSVIQKFEHHGVVVPTSMLRKLFTVGVVDNIKINHNSSSTNVLFFPRS
ncbi:hypothetical protein PoB_000860000 [Plakobranchus ocellatus]|uniref:Uncharacterized protein n=1 Tax=Plakobranchus ocellatus TaxID=259542 RepID=A0AAV3YH86_9GAST|nr:hypothetical protein PoB_000860000 [Plakobranchus ocellatus]